jgi:mRNA deadenylase 3'-5' endonuclease subunit Ccr4
MSHVNAFNQEENIWGNRDFLPAKKDLLIMGELSSMEKVSFMTYNVLSQLGARRLGGVQYGYVEEFVLRPMKRREILLRFTLSYLPNIYIFIYMIASSLVII